MEAFSKKSITSFNMYGILFLSNENVSTMEDVKKIISFLPTKKLLNTIVFRSCEACIILDASRLSDIEFITWKTGRSDVVLILDSFNRFCFHHVTGITPETIKPILERLGRYDIILKIS